MTGKLLTAAAMGALLIATGLAAADEDILGPIGPMPAPSPDGHPTRRAVAVSLAVGFGVLSVYLTRRSRRRRRLAVSPAAEPVRLPGDELLGLPDDEFYAELFRRARQAVGRGSALTPLELSQVAVPLGTDGWPEFCARIAGALYAATGATPEQKADDLRLVRDLVAQPEERGDGA